MRWQQQSLTAESPDMLPGLDRLSDVVQSVRSPEFAGMVFHEIAAKSALNRVPAESSRMPFAWTINPYRGCSHACVYCFARGSHRYLDLDTGKDFDTQIIVKTNIAEVLRHELAKPSWQHEHVALGTNTDPYQRAEGKYQLMPKITRALAESGTPFSILTKGTLLRRDLPLLIELRREVPISIAMSIAVFDDELQKTIEPGTPTTSARLATVTAAVEAGFPVSVFLMPVLPRLTDTTEHLDHALASIRAAGASHIVGAPLHLRSFVKPWFLQWLNEHHPHLVSDYATIYPGKSATAVADYRKWLGARIASLKRKHGFFSERKTRQTPLNSEQQTQQLQAEQPGQTPDFLQLSPISFHSAAAAEQFSQPTLF